jgi:REP element-mobilizing transposase RayT
VAKIIGYMVTWTTYGTWLQGDKRGYVKKGEVLKGDAGRERVKRARQKRKTVRLKKEQRRVVERAIVDEMRRVGTRVHAISVWSNHVHIVAECSEMAIEDFVRRCKNAAYYALRREGFEGRVWTRGYDKRFCFDEKSLKDRVGYVQRHD